MSEWEATYAHTSRTQLRVERRVVSGLSVDKLVRQADEPWSKVSTAIMRSVLANMATSGSPVFVVGRRFGGALFGRGAYVLANGKSAHGPGRKDEDWREMCHGRRVRRRA